MSYCVNCGVELAQSERICPLCGTEVVNPRQPYDRKAPKPFPTGLDLLTPDDHRGFNAVVLSLLFALPAAVCLACDVAYTRGAGWSMLVIGAAAMLWIFIVPALLIRRHRVLLCGILNTAALLGYLFIIERFLARGMWFMQLALPLVLLGDVLFVLDYVLIARVVRGRFRQAAVAVATVPLLLIGIEICLDLYLDGGVNQLWSYFVMIPCLLLAALLLVLDRRQAFKSQMRKRLHM